MARKQLYLAGDMAAANTPQVSLVSGKFRFNKILVVKAKIDNSWRIIISVDEDTRSIWFEFTNNPKKFEGTVKPIEAKHNGTFSCAAQQVIKTYSWVKDSFELPEKEQRRFSAVELKRGKEWRIDLIPAFENSVKRTEAKKKIKKNKFGIYRYIYSETGEIVYIGRGDILQRFNEDSRSNWIFDEVQYSYVDNENEREKFESYWIDQFKKYNSNKYPKYNKIGGKRKSKLK